MIILKLATNGLDLIRLETSLVTSDNKKSVTIEVTFDDSWTGYGKSATFKSSSSDKIYEVPLADDACVVPWEVLESVGTMSVGVRGVKDDGSVVASDLVDYKIAQGAKTGDGTSKDPTPTVYEQLLSNYGSVNQKITKEIHDRANAISKEKSERMTEVDVERKRIDNIVKLPSGSTSGDAELIDIRIGADGNTYNSAGTAIRKQVSSVKEDVENLNQKIFDDVLEHSSQLFDSSMANLNGYYNDAGTWSSNSDFSTQKICPIKPDTDIYTYRTFTYSSFFDVHGNWIESNINSPVETVIHAPKNAYTMYIGTATSIINQLFVSYSPDFFIWNHDANYIANRIEGITSYNYYNLPFIKKGRLCCNIDDRTTTAYYLGVNANTKTNLIRSKFIFENYNQHSGTVAMILLGNGCNKIQNIVDLSVHCTITSTHLTVDVLGKKFGTQKYQNIISVDLKTEHDAYMLVSNNTVIVNIDGTDYEGVFTPTNDISSLNDVIGNYAVLEHYCNGPRFGFNMPQFTYFQLKNNNTVILSDTFHRQDGVPQVSPQGHLYATYSYIHNIG